MCGPERWQDEAASTPAELDSVADFGNLAPVLKDTGYKPEDVEAMMGGNWLGVVKETLPRWQKWGQTPIDKPRIPVTMEGRLGGRR
ncbi:MAG: membrane dipeptidase [Chloroflexi bacterium]|nr:membrane dipeptidase [Chloroflexota bacterium]